MTDDEFLNCMDLWVRWMRKPDVSLSLPSRAAVCGHSVSNLMAGEEDSDIVYDHLDSDIAERVNACVDSLEPHERSAVYRAYGLANVFRFPRMDYAESLKTGMVMLRAKVGKKC